MKLSLPFLFEKIADHFDIRILGTSINNTLYSRPHLQVIGTALEENSLYIISGHAADPSSLSSKCGLLIAGRMPASTRLMFTESSNHLWVPNVTLEELFEFVQSLYDKMDAWDQEMMSELAKEQSYDIKKIIASGVSMMEASFITMDPSTKFIFKVDYQIDASGKPQITFIDNPGYISIDEADGMRKVCESERGIRTPYISKMLRDNHIRTYCFNLYPMGSFMGCASFSENIHSFRTGDLFVADHFFGIYQRAFLKYWRLEEQFKSAHTTIFNQFINGKCNTLPGCWMFFELRQKKDAKSMLTDYMYATLNVSMSGRVYAGIIGENVCGLLKASDTDDFVNQETLQHFLTLTQMMGYTAGFSNVITRFTLPDAYQTQANFAASKSVEDRKECLLFEDYALEFILKCSTADQPVDLLFTDCIRKLIAYDKAKNTEYVFTLKAYLENEKDLTATSDVLYIHRTTLIKRINRIQAISRVSLDDIALCLYCRIIFHLLSPEALQEMLHPATGNSA